MACRRHSLNKPKNIKIAYILPTNTVTDQSPRPLSNVKTGTMDRESRAKRIADLHVFYGQNEVVEALIRAGEIDEEYMYPFVDREEEVFEWWLVSPYLARELKEQGEIIINALDCYWWGRTTSGQVLYMDAVIRKIAGE